MQNQSRPRLTGLTLAMLWLGAAGIILYWVSYFTEGQVHAAADACYHVFQRNFPLPDGFVALCSILCAQALRRRQGIAVLWGLLAAGGYLFLAFIDIAYNLWNGIYRMGNSAVSVEALINAFCIGIAAWLVYFLWHNRRSLDAEPLTNGDVGC
jgi:hypothetical protein